ncbi:Lipopolysaccharide export system protein LptA [bacterium A37T11]|nr:Lipopolysaccharide export system protein LptA [bacterium A37T11]
MLFIYPIFALVKKSCFMLLVMLFPLMLSAQKVIKLLSSKNSVSNSKTGKAVYYRPVFGHEGSTLSADSAYLYKQGEDDTYFDAFNNVIITQPNGSVIYADKLHYVQSTRIAILTDHVRMVDQASVLTTNYLTYNMLLGNGTYTGGGRIVNQSDTITSQNGHYFDKTKDTYFRNNVVVRTASTLIYTDTMRYNSLTKMNFFYGPTNIKNKTGTGNLYTENGDYNTETKFARFGKNNLYTEDSKNLRGDSLYYDGILGSGKAVKNVFFIDTAQQIVMRGNLGLYDRATETTTMTDNAYIVLVTKSDSSNHDSSSVKTDSLKIDPAKTDSVKTDSVYMTADTLISQVIFLKNYKLANLNLRRDGGDLDEDKEENFTDDSLDSTKLDSTQSDSSKLKNLLKVPKTDSSKVDSTLLKSPRIIKPPDSLSQLSKDSIGADLLQDSLLRDSAIAPGKGTADSLLLKAEKAAMKTTTAIDTSISDTARTRIVKAYYEVKIFKSDLQAVADSAYYGYPDSVLRLYGRPMIWSQGSQLSSDTLYMQLKNQQLDNMLLKNNAFIASTDLDSSKYNQTKGRKITGFFKNNSLEIMYVDGNSEAIYYRVEKNKFVGMGRTLASRIKMLLENNAVVSIIPTKKVESNYYPLYKLPADLEILEGFSWRPKDRPKSKDDIILKKQARRQKDLPSSKTDSTKADSLKKESIPAWARDTLKNDTLKNDTLKNDTVKNLKTRTLQKVSQLLDGHPPVAQAVFLDEGHFSKGLIMTFGCKDGIIPESGCTAPFITDGPPHHPIKEIFPPA